MAKLLETSQKRIDELAKEMRGKDKRERDLQEEIEGKSAEAMFEQEREAPSDGSLGVSPEAPARVNEGRQELGAADTISGVLKIGDLGLAAIVGNDRAAHTVIDLEEGEFWHIARGIGEELLVDPFLCDVQAIWKFLYQRIALAWMVQKETSSMQCAGGIRADDQGLGKTMSTIAFNLKERAPTRKSNQKDSNENKTQTFVVNLDKDDME
eukprot:Gb_17290 [translate_table: standard]